MSLTRILSLLLVLATAAVYYQVYQFDYLNWDDPAYIVMNPAIEGFTTQNVTWAFNNDHVYNFHPLTWLSYMLDVQLFGRDAAVFHLVNAVLHGANVLLVFALLRTLTGDIWRGAFVAAVFAVHPLHVESVAWISERKDVLTTLFGLLTLLAYVRYARATRLRWIWYLLTIVTFALALLAKQTMVTLPFVMLLLDWWPLRRTQAAGKPEEVGLEVPKSNTASWLQLVLEKIPLFALTIAFCVIVITVQKPGVDEPVYFSFPIRVMNAVLAYGLYLKKTIWPFDLAAFYPHPGDSISRAAVGVSALMLFAITVLCVSARRQRPFLLVGWFWFLGTLVPMIGLVQVGQQQMADRNMYFPLIGLTIIVAWLVPELLPKGQLRAKLLPTATAVVLCVFGLEAFVQAGYWQDSVTLFRETLARTRDNYVAHNVLGDALHAQALDLHSQSLTLQSQAVAQQSQQLAQESQILSQQTQSMLDEAATEFDKSIKLNPVYASPLLNLANLKRDRGDLLGSEPLYQSALKLQPEDPQTLTDYGEMLLAQDRFDEALLRLQKAVDLAPYFPEAHNGLGRAFAGKGDSKTALGEFARAVLLNPQLIDGYLNIAMILIQDQRYDDAITELDEALSIDPTHGTVRTLAIQTNLESGQILVEAGDSAEAGNRFDRALALVASDQEAYTVSLIAGRHLTKLNSPAIQLKAVQYLEQAVQIQPESAEANSALGQVLLKRGDLNAALEKLGAAVRLNPSDAAAQAALREAQEQADDGK